MINEHRKGRYGLRFFHPDEGKSSVSVQVYDCTDDLVLDNLPKYIYNRIIYYILTSENIIRWFICQDTI